MKHIKLLVFSLALIVILAGSQSLVTVQAQPTTIFYDDGTAESCWIWLGSGGKYLVRFTAPFAPYRISGISFFVLQDPGPVKVRLLDGSRNETALDVNVDNVIEGWNTVNLTLSNTYLSDTDFYLGVENLQPEVPCIGADVFRPNDRSFMVSPIGDWASSLEVAQQEGSDTPNFDLMIRAMIDRAPDSDSDGLADFEESRLGTNPNVPDSDGDGLTDGDEVRQYRTNPARSDTDGDGLSDGMEVSQYKSDPLRTDTDGDGLSDGEEVNQYHSDPTKADTDDDGLTDQEETSTFHTDPTKADTDGDTINDSVEISRNLDPTKADTDGDGLDDSSEARRRTDPLLADTDSDFWNDSLDPLPLEPLIPNVVIVIAVVVIVGVLGFRILSGRRQQPPVVTTTYPQVTTEAPVPAMKFCVNCGSQIPQAAIYCAKCGASQT
jgi:hypothetical protein